MTILYLSDFDLGGSGYMNIGVNLCQGLVNQGKEVMALGLGYKRTPHDYPFAIVPLDGVQLAAPAIQQLMHYKKDIEVLIVALDIPLQEAILVALEQFGIDIPYIGLFPLENKPLCMPWALSLLKMDRRLIMSQFGQEALAEKGVESTFIPLGVTDDWYPPTEEERAALRQGLNIEPGTFVVLTVADNQERKNLSAAMQTFAKANIENSLYILVTRGDSPVGWKLADYAQTLEIYQKYREYNRGMPQDKLRALYHVADCFLLTSKAEGLAIPVMESMACRLPVIGTRVAAIEEHLSDVRGLLIEPEYHHIDVWGNSERAFVSIEDGSYKLKLLKFGFSPDDYKLMLDRAEEYVKSRTWDKAVGVLMGEIEICLASRLPGSTETNHSESREQLVTEGNKRSKRTLPL